jgi:hypothetical protein
VIIPALKSFLVPHYRHGHLSYIFNVEIGTLLREEVEFAIMAPQTVNILLSSFPGLSLPQTLSISLLSNATIGDLTDKISSLLPSSLIDGNGCLVITTTSNKQLSSSSSETLASLLSLSHDDSSDSAPSVFIPVRLTAALCGGKGGFGSQLRAAGGRMSSKRKGNQAENNGSNRNLDGRRLRTVNEAKALAEYLALKPEMDKKQKEERRRRWEMVVEAAERRQQELRNGEGAGKGKGKVDGAWMEDKEEVGEKAREAVLRAMKDGIWKDNLAGGILGMSSTSASESSGSGGSQSGSDEEDVDMVGGPSGETTKRVATRRFAGFDDDDDEFMSDSEEDNDEEDIKGKGKGRA